MHCSECNFYIGDMEWGDVIVVCPRSSCHKISRFTKEREDARAED